MASRSNKPYKEGELEIVLSLPPTATNIYWLSKLLDREAPAIEIIYKIAFEHGPFAKGAGAQQKKIAAAKKRVWIGIGRKKTKPASLPD